MLGSIIQASMSHAVLLSPPIHEGCKHFCPQICYWYFTATFPLFCSYDSSLCYGPFLYCCFSPVMRWAFRSSRMLCNVSTSNDQCHFFSRQHGYKPSKHNSVCNSLLSSMRSISATTQLRYNWASPYHVYKISIKQGAARASQIIHLHHDI